MEIVLVLSVLLMMGSYSGDDPTWEWPEDDAEIYSFVDEVSQNCTRGCKCGNACIDCSKTCRKGSSGGCSAARDHQSERKERIMGYVILWIVCGFIGAAVSRKDKKVYGGLIGFLLGPFGVLISAIAFREQH